jgi:hypothetical protein
VDRESRVPPGEEQNELSLRWKPRSNFSLSFGLGYSQEKTEVQSGRRVEDPLMLETYGARYVFVRMDQRTVSGEIRLNWILIPRLSLQLYLQPVIAVATFDKFKELAKPKTYDHNVYGDGDSTINYEGGLYTVAPDGGGLAESFSFWNPDFNYKSLRGTVVLKLQARVAFVRCLDPELSRLRPSLRLPASAEPRRPPGGPGRQHLPGQIRLPLEPLRRQSAYSNRGRSKDAA